MDAGIEAETPLDFATIKIFPSQNRYEAFVCCGDKVDALTAGVLDSLLPHLPDVKELYAEGSNATFKLQVPDTVDVTSWFTKSTLSRFLLVVGSRDLLNITNTITDEMAQLEEAKRFEVSLYGEADKCAFSRSRKADGCNLHKSGPILKRPGDEAATSDASRNELLRAIDLRLEALRRDLAAALDKAAGATCSFKEISYLDKFSQYFGAVELRNFLCKILEQNMNNESADHVYSPGYDSARKIDAMISIMHSTTPVKYGASPAKVAQVERLGLTESEESSDSSNEDGMPSERSRPLVRSATPRRSASPMRRVQIGRNGSRRVAAITIKSLNNFQTRERMLGLGDVGGASSEEEATELPSKKPDNNIRRMSVQDAINLFESKQRDQATDIQKRGSLADIAVTANKSVLRRWSAGMGVTSTRHQPEIACGESISVTPIQMTNGEMLKISEDSTAAAAQNTAGTAQIDVDPERSEVNVPSSIYTEADFTIRKEEEVSQELTASSEWNRAKEEELQKIVMKLEESKPTLEKKRQVTRTPNLPSEKGGFYDQYKAKRDEKLRGENVKKRANREAQFKAMKQMLDESKAGMASAKVIVPDRKRTTLKPQVSQKNVAQPGNPKKETGIPSVSKKITSKTSPTPAVRKSWPSLQTASTTRSTSTPKMPAGRSSSVTTPTHRKPQSTPPPSRPSNKTEKPQPRQRNVKENHDSNRSVKRTVEKERAKDVKTLKPMASKPSGDSAGKVPNSILRNKTAKKSSVVPLEVKPPRKNSGMDLDSSSVVNKSKRSPEGKDSLKSSQNLSEAQDNEVLDNVVLDNASDQPNQHREGDVMLPVLDDVVADSELAAINIESEKIDAARDEDDMLENVSKSSLEIQVEEPKISSKSWVEIEEHEDMPPHDGNTSQIASLEIAEAVRFSSPRVRHSLSQMLQEETSESDTADWGIAEYPPTSLYQKEAPKGLKRLLKFARKSKGEASLSGWSSPSVVSEGEDDSEESKAFSKRNADSLLRKATLQAMNNGHVGASVCKNQDTHEQFSTHSNAKNFSRNLPDIHDAFVVPATKGRSFFSLSAFKGSKPNEPKHR